ncbi:NADH:flavin oxidoreductase [Paenibacillus tarimensis]
MTDNLFTSMTIGGLTLDNRVGVAPMTRTSATPEGLATEAMISYYASFAHGGFGFIITEGIYPDDKFSQGYLNQPGLVTNEHVQSWRRVVEAVHQEGGKIIAQLMHAGALSQGNRFADTTIAPSAVLPKGEQMEFYGGKGPFREPREATKEDIQQMITGFAQAAKRAMSAGFDGVEIHGANGYVLDQFLTDYTNRRLDEYGGSTENRVRLLVEVINAVKEAVGDKFTVGIRISQGKVNDYTHKWAGREKEAAIIFGQIGTAKPDYIHVTEYEAWQPAFPEGEGTHATDPAFEKGQSSLAALAKRYGGVPVMANGKLDNPDSASTILAKGEADLITIGKGALANHDWVNKVKHNQPLAVFQPDKILSPDATIKPFETELVRTPK